jgi:hypothetical protein
MVSWKFIYFFFLLKVTYFDKYLIENRIDIILILGFEVN